MSKKRPTPASTRQQIADALKAGRELLARERGAKRASGAMIRVSPAPGSKPVKEARPQESSAPAPVAPPEPPVREPEPVASSENPPAAKPAAGSADVPSPKKTLASRGATAAAKGKPAPPKKRVVVLVPPLLMPAFIMGILYLRLRRAGYQPRLFRYPSYRRDIPDNARRLAKFLRDLKEDEIDVVAFSLGAILLRWASNHDEIPKLRRVVMLGPPNQGAFMADWLRSKLGMIFPLVWGRCAMQLRRGDLGLCSRAGKLPPTTELGVVAGGTGRTKGFNPIIPGDNDLTVGVAETVLPGMSDFALVKMTHSGLPLAPKSTSLILRFLQTGRFRDRQKSEH